MDESSDARIAAVAARQHATFARCQALASGFTDGMIARRRASGRWETLHPGVYALAGSPRSWLRTVWAAVLAAEPVTVVSHEPALLMQGADERRVRRLPLEVIVPPGHHHRISGCRVHQIGDLAAHHVAEVGGLLVTVPARAIVDLAATVGPRRLADLVDVATDQLTTTAHIARCAAEVARRGKPGIARLGSVLDARGPGYVPPQSILEARLFDALEAAGLPAPRRQLRLPGRGALDGLVDAAYPQVRLIVEADGRRWHTRVRDLHRDHLRDAEAARVGWQTLRLLYEDIVANPAEAARTVRDVIEVRRRQQGTAA
jgi:hypothetical protein